MDAELKPEVRTTTGAVLAEEARGLVVRIASSTGMAVPLFGFTTCTFVADTAVATTLLAASDTRAKFSVYNSSSATLNLRVGGTATTTLFSVRLATGDYFESLNDFRTTLEVTGFWDTDPGDGGAHIMSYGAG